MRLQWENVRYGDSDFDCFQIVSPEKMEACKEDTQLISVSFLIRHCYKQFSL